LFTFAWHTIALALGSADGCIIGIVASDNASGLDGWLSGPEGAAVAVIVTRLVGEAPISRLDRAEAKLASKDASMGRCTHLAFALHTITLAKGSNDRGIFDLVASVES
jgi:hypothetical protein